MYRVRAMTFCNGPYNAPLSFRICVWEMVLALEKAQDDFIPTDDMLEEICGDEKSVEGMDKDLQLENETEETR